MIQYVIVGAAVVFAAWVIVRRIVRSVIGADGACGRSCGCGGSNDAKLGRKIDLIQLRPPNPPPAP